VREPRHLPIAGAWAKGSFGETNRSHTVFGLPPGEFRVIVVGGTATADLHGQATATIAAGATTKVVVHVASRAPYGR
jgi:hypothetical protein